MSRLTRFFASAVLILSFLAFMPGSADARWRGGYWRGGWGWGPAFGLGLGLGYGWGWGYPYAYANYDNCWVWDGYEWADVCSQSYAWY